MNDKIFLDAKDRFFENELIFLLNKYDLEKRSFARRKEGAVSSPLLWIVEIGRDNLESLLSIKNALDDEGIPVIVLSSEKSAAIREECYLMGTDDYVEKPWFSRVIAMRVETVLKRRYSNLGTRRIKWSHRGVSYVLDKENRRLIVDERQVELTPSLWNLFSTLLMHGNNAVSRDFLLKQCFLQVNSESRTLDNHMKNLRRDIGSPELIETVRGYGYRLRGETC